MKKYFIEFGPEYNRTFINRPPVRPLGPIKQITEEQWEQLKDIHPSNWKLENDKIIAQNYQSDNTVEIKINRMPILINIGLFLLGLIIGYIIK